ncbi:hypothetical protein [Xenorhabdus sp. KJ12.1]|uniref:hypothetical protein n=1 Tax=Xenorhabdus sp. KJ12.1 TaxID=1851571 RepID=UPI000C056ADD|nr:hypothetical protein [Xenorhabdus sp. KJ12.1]PHM65502.1 hypothetical protein Xekj_04256 [Xenorhabdus sp. KJ12.1]
MNTYPRRSPGCFVPKDPKERERYLNELVAAISNKTPHPAIMSAKERVLAERLFNINYKSSFNPPLPQHMQEQRDEEIRQGWREYWSKNSKEHDHYRGESPRRHNGGIWTGD